ncbi:MAG: hypothetical protein JRJ12_03850 [Deltaproteobacteria bacterium]|nr:hypothetical protein [Deltaproteobacteria bacterium]MBW2070199.1 hypothetical protein [Deltaproteobacteria bacterium]
MFELTAVLPASGSSASSNSEACPCCGQRQEHCLIDCPRGMAAHIADGSLADSARLIRGSVLCPWGSSNEVQTVVFL